MPVEFSRIRVHCGQARRVVGTYPHCRFHIYVDQTGDLERRILGEEIRRYGLVLLFELGFYLSLQVIHVCIFDAAVATDETDREQAKQCCLAQRCDGSKCATHDEHGPRAFVASGRELRASNAVQGLQRFGRDGERSAACLAWGDND